MTKQLRIGLVGFLGAVGGLAVICIAPASSATEESKDAAQPVAVEGDMHEFMEYVFEPPYKRLKAGLASAPADRAAWKGIKSDSLILAEATNLLLHRQPDESANQWVKNAQNVRQQGSQLYQAAKKRDFDLSQKQFAAMLKTCNQCHDQFADGEHQLTP
jgi:hypothetical protein